MSTDNRYQINDCEANTGWFGNDTANAISSAGSFIEGSGALSTQLSNADEHMATGEDSTATGTFSFDMTDVTVYMNIKDNLFDAYSAGGVQFVLGDGSAGAGDLIGYDIAGNDAIGMVGKFFFTAYKLDVSEAVATPGGHTVFNGTEAGLAHNAITEVGYGSIHLAKAVGSVDNVIMDGFYYIANDSYALTINGGTSGTPETMADVAGDDATNGWNLVTNPLGSQYIFFGPTEWGESAAAADHYFTASSEQWYWVGDNAGGRAVGATHFPFRVVGNATDAGSFVINAVVIVNTGVPSEFDCSDTDIDTLEIAGCSMDGLASFSAPSSGGTSRLCETTIFNNCGQITHNGASMNECSISGYTGALDTSSLVYNETSNPNGVMDDITFNKGSAAHHAIEFGLSSPLTMTITGINFSGFNAANAQNDSALHIKRTSGTVNITVSGGSGTVSYKTDGATVNILNDVTVTFTGMKDNTEVRVYKTSDNSVVDGIENATAGSVDDRSFAWSAPAATDVYYILHNFHDTEPDYESIRVEGYIVPSSNTSIAIQQRIDRNSV